METFTTISCFGCLKQGIIEMIPKQRTTHWQSSSVANFGAPTICVAKILQKGHETHYHLGMYQLADWKRLGCGQWVQNLKQKGISIERESLNHSRMTVWVPNCWLRKILWDKWKKQPFMWACGHPLVYALTAACSKSTKTFWRETKSAIIFKMSIILEYVSSVLLGKRK